MLIKKSASLFEIALLIFGIIAFASITASFNTPIISAVAEELAPGVTLSQSSQSTNKLGCCIDTDQGFCSPTSLKSECEATENGEFHEDEFCNVEGNICDRGCCILGIESMWATKKTCEKQSELLGIVGEFKNDVANELACIDASRKTEVGACLYQIEDEASCSFTSFSECDNNNGEFYRDTLCSNEALESNCEKQARTGCLEGRDEIYWYDSCGNPENIYSSDRDASWNNGMVLTKEQSCGTSSPNINSESCGNCDYNAGSICSEENNDKSIKDGTAICKNLNCKSAPSQVDARGKVLATKNRINGESWCIYDGPIGGMLFGQDLIGSRHYKYVCSNGEVEVEPCQDYRQEICVEKKESGKTDAMCRVNTWEQCLAANNDGGEGGCEGQCMTKCISNPDCRIHGVYVDEKFHFTVCVPKYTPGFETAAASGLGDLVGESAGELVDSTTESNGGASDICAAASQTCTSTWKKKCPSGKWECQENCECHSESFTIQMNNLCVSMGDCGSFANLMGKPVLGGARIKKEGDHGRTPMQPALMGIAYMALSYLLSMGAANGGIYDDIPDISELGGGGLTGLADPFLGNIGLNEFGGGGGGQSQIEGMFSGGQLGATIGMAGTAGVAGGATAAAMGAGGAATFATGAAIPAGTTLAGGSTVTLAAGTSMTVTGASGASLAAATAGTGATAVGTTVTAGAGAATVTVPAGATVTATAGAGTTGAGAGATATGASVGWGAVLGWAAAVVVVVLVIMYLAGCGKEETVEIQFTCSPSGAPIGADCSACDGGKLKPCSKYKCESLGAMCRIINENTGEDDCVVIDAFLGPPKISPNEDVLNKSMFSYADVTNNGFRVKTADGNCINSYTPLSIGLKTDVHAKCRFGTEKGAFEELTSAFLEGDIFSINHTLILTLPSVEAMAYSAVPVPENLEDETAYQEALEEAFFQARKMAQDINYYVKCISPQDEENINDYKINFCVNPNADLTGPAVTATSPPTGSIIKYTATEKNITIYLTEPSDCKWGTINPNLGNLSESYNTLSNQMNCKINAGGTSLLSYTCTATLPINETESNFYFQCKDQPWLNENSSRNIGSIYPYSLFKSKSELKIDSISPAGEIISGAEPLTITINAETSGGAYQGISTCDYKISTIEYTNSSFIEFFKSKNSKHSQPGLQFMSGDYYIDVRCEDTAGNTAENRTTISLKLDSTPPIVTRAFRDNSGLKILTNEQATCFYSFSSCQFDTSEAVEIKGQKSTEHILEWNPDSTYYIRCKDGWGNSLSGCSIVVRPSQL